MRFTKREKAVLSGLTANDDEFSCCCCSTACSFSLLSSSSRAAGEWAPVTISFARILSLALSAASAVSVCVLMLRNEADFVVDEEPFFFLPRVKGTTQFKSSHLVTY